jgi:hypothetical protein
VLEQLPAEAAAAMTRVDREIHEEDGGRLLEQVRRRETDGPASSLARRASPLPSRTLFRMTSAGSLDEEANDCS